MEKIKLLFLAILTMIMLSCEKEIIEPVFNHVTLSTEVKQVSYGAKPDYEIKYTNNNVTNGEISIELLDENRTRLAWLPNSTLVGDSGIIGINNVPQLTNGKQYFIKIENFKYDDDYYQFNTDEDTVYNDEVLLEFKAYIKDGVMYPSIEAFDINVADNLGLQKAIKYGGKVYGESITINNLSIFVGIENTYPWEIFERIVLRDSEGLIIQEKYSNNEHYWVNHNDSIYELKMHSLGYNIEPGYFNHQIDLEISNCIETSNMMVNIRGDYYNGEYGSFETEVDTLRIIEF